MVQLLRIVVIDIVLCWDQIELYFPQSLGPYSSTYSQQLCTFSETLPPGGGHTWGCLEIYLVTATVTRHFHFLFGTESMAS